MLRTIFATWGIPEEIVSDNGRTYQSAELPELNHGPTFTWALMASGIKAYPMGSGGIRSGIFPTSVSTSDKVGFDLFRPRPFDLALWRPCATFSLGPRPDPTARKVGSARLDQGLVPSAKPMIPLGWDLSLFSLSGRMATAAAFTSTG